MILRKLKVNDALRSDMSNFGPSFKRAREAKGISLDHIASETRISTRFLLAIENEEFNLLPGGIFNRGFVRAFAEKVGLDPDQAVADYERLVKVQEPPEAAVATPLEAKGKGLFYPLAIACLVVVIVIFYLVTKETSNTAQTASPLPTASASTVAQPTVTSTPNPPTPVDPVPAAPPAPLAPPTTPPEVTSAAPEPQPPVATVALRIDVEITETTWIKVAADGTTVDPGEVLEQGTTRHFTAQNSIYLSVGNAGGIALKINDMPAKNLGKSGQVRQLTITPQNFKSFIG
jgi:cytoskeletal protein RodZ